MRDKCGKRYVLVSLIRSRNRVLSNFSVVFSACALGITALNGYGRTVWIEQPIRVYGAIECLPNQTTSTQDGDEKYYPGEPNADTGEANAEIHEN